ncbi:LysR substrate-binding domain-containing protein [Chitinophaga arvensicola]|uniref:DNA-binding transcriptional regulator, LysR family n=1 Tax=Chitinophaga arvensicola TaxID=29529 RepID=A0A1I0SBH3_9BACT|nr:LysR substrate-binding domain-containing protein [Chitinophaga arvensicola]SEW54042.1 DNA-binding transcriptional regulator, LysR family [Chitinophaga arvensicola]
MVTDLLELDLLRTFVLAVDLDSFARAAEQVSRSQSAVSLQMQRLEEISGQQLFVKQGRGWQLTAAGEILLSYARQILDLNQQAIQALTATHIAGKVKLGLPADFAESGLPVVLAQFAAVHPQMEVEVTLDRQTLLLQQLQSGKLDVILSFGKEIPAAAIPLGYLPIRWIGNTNKNIAQLQPLPLLLFEPPCVFRSIGLAALEKAKRTWRPALTSGSVAGMWAAAQAGLGITIRTEIGLPAGCVALPASSGLPALPDVAVYMLTYKKTPSPAVKRLIDILYNTIEAQVKDITKNSHKKAPRRTRGHV